MGTLRKRIFSIDNKIWACGGMVDTLVLGTSAKAWEFESLHAQFNRQTFPSTNELKGFL